MKSDSDLWEFVNDFNTLLHVVTPPLDPPFHNILSYFLSGSIEAVNFLMNMGAPAGVYDSFGNSAMVMMIEKVPQYSYEALNQFFVEDSAMRRRYYYLDHLEFDVKSKGHAKDARNVLEV